MNESETRSDSENEREYVFRFRAPKGVNPLFWLPDETQGHLRASMRENLLAVRSLIDAAIDQMENADDRSSGRGERIEVS